jgi:hypothetical protein
LKPILHSFADVFQPGRNISNIVLPRFKLTDNIPVRSKPYKVLDPNKKQFIYNEVQEMLAAGIVEPAESPYSSPIVLIKKDQGYRFCIDFRRVNKKIETSNKPLRDVNTVLASLAGATVFTTLDLAAGYHQCKIQESDRRITAFGTEFGEFQFKVLPFGLSNASALFQEAMDQVFTDCPNTIPYVDDVIIFSGNMEEHKQHLSNVLQQCRAFNIKLKASKCKFGRSSVTYLGHIVSTDGIRKDPTKVEAIVNYPQPKTPRSLRRFLGMFNYMRKFVNMAADITQPLSNLLKGNPKNIDWSDEANESFLKAKEAIATDALLRHPDFRKPFTLNTDASIKAIAAVLLQDGKPIGFASRLLSKSEKNYSATELELLAVIFGISYFREFLEFKPFTIVTDHKALLWLANVHETKAKLYRWYTYLQNFRFTVKHINGAMNAVPDALSRALVISKEEILHAYHENEISGGHSGMKRTLEKIRRNYTWKGMAKDVKNWVTSCNVCQTSKSSVPTKTYTRRIPISDSTPWQNIAMDIVGPLPTSRNSMKYILTIGDYATRFVEAHAMRSARTEEVIDIFLNKHVTRYGPPETILTDNGKQFAELQLIRIIKMLQAKKIYTSIYHPQTDGFLERSHKTLAQILRSYGNEDTWDEHLPFAVFTLNTSINSTTNETPFKLLYGYDPRIPLEEDITRAYRMEDKEGHRAPKPWTSDAIDAAYKHIIQLRKNATDHFNAVQQQKEDKDKQTDEGKHEDITYEEGQLVWMKTPGDLKKFDLRFLGPFRVKKRISPTTYIIADLDNPRKEKMVHVQNLKKVNTRQPMDPPKSATHPSSPLQQDLVGEGVKLSQIDPTDSGNLNGKRLGNS